METTTMAGNAAETLVAAQLQAKSELPLFVVVKDSNGMEYKICNMNHPDICPRKGHIVLDSIRKSKRHETNIRFTNVKDRNTGIIYGILQGFDNRTKEPMFQRIILGDKEEYDLTNLQDAQVWAVVRMHSSVDGSPLQYGKPSFKVQNKELDAEKTITKAKERDRASSIAQQLKGLQLGDMCRNLGIPPEHSSYNLMLAQVLESANTDPKKFLDVWDNTNRSVLTIINRSKAVGLLQYDSMKGFLWRNGLPIGSNEMQMIDYLTKNIQLLTTMDHDSKELDKFYKEYGDAIEPEPPTSRDELTKVKNEYAKELEEVRKLKEVLAMEIERTKNKAETKDLKK